MVNGEDRLSLAGKEPISHEIFAVNLDPRLHKAQLVGLEFTAQYFPIGDREHCFLLLIANMDVWQVVLALVEKGTLRR
jgi:hypothetical protein